MTHEPAVRTVVVGPVEFAESVGNQGGEAIRVDWSPPAAAEALTTITRTPGALDRIREANDEAVDRLLSARCRLVDTRRASDVIPALVGRTLLHAGPPLDWTTSSGPMRGALIGATLLEGWAPDADAAVKTLERGEIELFPCHEHRAVGPMAGVISPSMPVFVVENEAFGETAYATINEGLGRVLRYGAYDAGVLDRLKWIAEVVGPALATAIAASGGLELSPLIAQALQMGDELHNRNRASTALFSRAVAPALVSLIEPGRVSAGDVASILEYLAQTDVFFLNLAMAACKAALDPATGVKGSTLVTCMARNGTEFGIRCSGTGDRWFTAPAPEIEGLFFPGFGPDDANPDLGDSAITETAGLGGFALAAAPAIVQFVGGSVELGREITTRMYEITLGEHPQFQIPALDFRGSPTGIDAFRVCRTGIVPVVDTGIAHKEAGIGQIGAGIVRVPIKPFADALDVLTQGI